MDIRNWPIDRIMQLPDCCFGRRWPVGVYAGSNTTAEYYDISEAGLGDKCVIWSVHFISQGSATSLLRFSLALGDTLPTTPAQFDALEPLFSDLGRRDVTRRILDLGGFGVQINIPMRYPVMAQGRRIVMFLQIVGSDISQPFVILVISSFPTEVPEWLISGQGRGL